MTHLWVSESIWLSMWVIFETRARLIKWVKLTQFLSQCVRSINLTVRDTGIFLRYRNRALSSCCVQAVFVYNFSTSDTLQEICTLFIRRFKQFPLIDFLHFPVLFEKKSIEVIRQISSGWHIQMSHEKVQMYVWDASFGSFQAVG